MIYYFLRVKLEVVLEVSTLHICAHLASYLAQFYCLVDYVM